MTIMTNIRGTSETEFRISLTGPTVYTGSTDPNATPPTPIDALAVGDMYLRQGGTGEGWFYNGTTWDQILVSGGTFSVTDFNVSGDLTVGGAADFADGTAPLPSITFTNDINLGFYRAGADDLGITTGGVDTMRIATDRITHLSQGLADLQIDYTRTGSALDEKTWSIDIVSSGLNINTRDDAGAIVEPVYRVTRSAGVVGTHTWYSGISPVLTVNQTSLLPTVPVRGQDGTTLAPAFTFDANNNTGMYRPGLNQIGFSNNANATIILNEVNTGGSSLVMFGNDAITVAAGTTAQQPGTPADGMFRYNTDTPAFEGYVNGTWETFNVSDPATFLLSANDLSDVADVPTARANLGLVAGGLGDIWVEKAGDTMTGVLTMNADIAMGTGDVLLRDGSAIDPSMSFFNDQNSGFFRVGGDIVGFAANGIEGFQMSDHDIALTNADLFVNDNAIIFNSDVAIGNNHHVGLNLDHIWFEDLTNQFHFAADTTYKAVGDAAIRAGGIIVETHTSPAAADLTIAGGVVTVVGSFHRVDTEAAAAADDLDTINGGLDGQRLVLTSVDSARDVTLTHAVGNLRLAGGVSFTLGENVDTVELIYSDTLSEWLMISGTNNV